MSSFIFSNFFDFKIGLIYCVYVFNNWYSVFLFLNKCGFRFFFMGGVEEVKEKIRWIKSMFVCMFFYRKENLGLFRDNFIIKCL